MDTLIADDFLPSGKEVKSIFGISIRNSDDIPLSKTDIVNY